MKTSTKNDYNLSVSAYVEKKDDKKEIDIKSLNQEIKQIVSKIDHLRASIDAIVADLER